MKKLVLGSVIAALLPLNVGSQTPSTSVSPSSSQGQFTLKTSTEVVLVNVTVRDKNDNFVKGLKSQDFTILEDGKKQDVISLDVENTDAAITSEAPKPQVLSDLNTAPNAPPPPKLTPTQESELKD